MANEISSHMPGSGRQYREDSTVVNLADCAEASLGRRGALVVADTNEKTAGAGLCYSAIQMLSDTVFTSHSSSATAPMTADSLAGISIAAGTVIYGKFLKIKLASGTAIAYLGAL